MASIQLVLRRVGYLALGFASLAVLSASAPAPPVVLFLGTSITAGFGIDPAEAFPALVQKKIDARGWHFRAVNAGQSGDTSAGGLNRLEWLLKHDVEVLVLELGANDGLRGLPVEVTRENLQTIIDRTKERYPKARVVIAGMKVPPNMGSEYSRQFEAIFPEIAKKNRAPLIPFILEGVGGVEKHNLPDGIHPTPKGHEAVAHNVWRVLEPVLNSLQ